MIQRIVLKWVSKYSDHMLDAEVFFSIYILALGVTIARQPARESRSHVGPAFGARFKHIQAEMVTRKHLLKGPYIYIYIGMLIYICLYGGPYIYILYRLVPFSVSF